MLRRCHLFCDDLFTLRVRIAEGAVSFLHCSHQMSSGYRSARLWAEFCALETQLQAFRNGAEGGLTALRNRLNALTVAALAADDDGAYLVVNDAAAGLTGYRVAELERMNVWDLTPAMAAEVGAKLWSAFLADGEQHGIYDLQGKDQVIRGLNYYARAHVLPHVHVSLLQPHSGNR